MLDAIVLFERMNSLEKSILWISTSTGMQLALIVKSVFGPNSNDFLTLHSYGPLVPKSLHKKLGNHKMLEL